MIEHYSIGPMESQPAILMKRLVILKEICNTLSACGYKKKYGDILQTLINIESKYMIIIAPIICENKSFSDFLSIIKVNNIEPSINEIYDKIKYEINEKKFTITKTSLVNIKKLIESYPSQSLLTCQNINDNDMCCGKKMSFDKSKTSFCCEICGHIRENFDSCEDIYLFGSSIIKTKQSSNSRRNEHYERRLQRILAQESDTEIGDAKDSENLYGEKLIANLQKIVDRDGKKLQLLTVHDIRLMLAELGKNNLYDHTSLILTKLTGNGPPNLPENIREQLGDYFARVLEINEKFREKNQKFYPYYIMKILDCILPLDSKYRRILYFIYIQKKDTIETNDQEWEQICTELDDPLIKYRPTERDFNLKYR